MMTSEQNRTRLPSRGLVLLLWGACAVPVAAQRDKQPLPLYEGTRWTYEVSHGDEVPDTVTVVDGGAFRLPAGGDVHRLTVLVAGATGVQHEAWAMPDYGLYSYVGVKSGGRGMIDLAQKPMRLWASNTAGVARREWQWRGPVIGRLFGVGAASHPGLWRHHGESLGEKWIVVPLGKYGVEHVRIRSELDGQPTQVRDLWFARGVGIVQQVVRVGDDEWRARLVERRAGTGDAAARKMVIDHLESRLRKGIGKPFNNDPRVTWVDAAPEAMLLPGRVAVVRTDAWTDCFYVDEERVMRFDPMGGLAGVAQQVFGRETARPPEDMPLKPLALLLARTEAARHQMGNLRETEVTLKPPRPMQTGGRGARVELVGGMLDSTLRRIAVWIQVGKRAQVQVATDIPPEERRK